MDSRDSGSAERLDEPFDEVGLDEIVGVEEDHDRGRRLLEAGVRRGTLPTIRALEDADRRFVPPEHFEGVVSRSVVDHDHLDVDALGKSAVDSRAHVAGIVEVGDDDARRRSLHDDSRPTSIAAA